MGQNVEYRVGKFVALGVSVADDGRQVGYVEFFEIGLVSTCNFGRKGFALWNRERGPDGTTRRELQGASQVSSAART